MGKRVTFSKEFKIEAVRLLDLGKKSAVELALELGVRRNQLYKWKELLSKKKEAAFRGCKSRSNNPSLKRPICSAAPEQNCGS